MSSHEILPMTTGVYRHTMLERVIHGQPFEKAVAEEVLAHGSQRVMIVAAPQANASASLARLSAALEARCAGVFCGALPHVPMQCVYEGALQARQCKADHLVAMGGGSVIDAAKAIALLMHKGTAANVSTLLDTQDLSLVDPARRSDADSGWLRITAVPQTLSAAEFTWFAGVSDPARKVKNIVAHAAMIPRSVILDPALTQEFPLSAFLASGVKAVDHAIERLVALNSHPMSDALSLHALRMLSQALPEVHRQPDELGPRLQCQLASWLSIAGGSAGVKTGASHALGHVLGAHMGVSHGLTSCVLLPSVLRWNWKYNQQQQLHVMSALGESGGDLATWVERFVDGFGLPTQLRKLGVAKDDLPGIAWKSLHDPGMRHNPRPARSAADALEILEAAW